MIYIKTMQQIRIYLVIRCGFAQIWLWIDRFNADCPHEPQYPLPVDYMTLFLQCLGNLPVSIKRTLQIFFKNQPFVYLLFFILTRLIVICRPCKTQETALPFDGKYLMVRLNHVSVYRKNGSNFFFNHSFSIFIMPI